MLSKNSFIYIRTSTEDQTPQLQLADISTLEPPPDSIILEEQMSAWKDNVVRPQFEKIISLIKKNQVENLYVWSIDRIFRKRVKLKEFFLLCKLHNVKVYSYCQHWLNHLANIPPPFNEMMQDLMISMLGWLAEEESTLKSKRVKMAVRRTGAKTVSHNGNIWGRKPLSNHVIEKVKELNKQGLSIREIANKVKYYDKNKNEQKISKSAVHKIIANLEA